MQHRATQVFCVDIMALELPGPCNGELPELALPDPDECDEDIFQLQPVMKKRRGAAKAKSQGQAKSKAVAKPKGESAEAVPKPKAAPKAKGADGQGPPKAKAGPKTQDGQDLLKRLLTEVGM